MYRQSTQDIDVEVTPIYVEDRSAPDEGRWFWTYQVRIANFGNQPVRLIKRHWHITDARGRVQTVRGAGVVGAQPRLEPGEAFEYTSGTPLGTSSGIMMGQYEMVTDGGEVIEVQIPAFSLDTPDTARVLN